jgi:hypothetical protein
LGVVKLDCKGSLSDKALNNGKDKRMLTSVYEGGDNVLVPEELLKLVIILNKNELSLPRDRIA